MTVPHSLWEGIASTSFWFYYVFFGLVYFGYLARKPRIQRAAHPAILPSVFILLSGLCFFLTPLVTPYLMSGWVGLLCLGIALGWLQAALFRLKPLADHRHVYVAGSNRLLLCLALFVVGWLIYLSTGLRFRPIIDPQQIFSQAYLFYVTLAYGLATGLIIGRSLRLRYSLKHGPFYDGPLPTKLP